MAYRQVYFRIRSSFRGYEGWTAKEDKTLFIEETRRLFQNDGWELHVDQSPGACDTVTKGLQDLYLHPMNISGVVSEDDIPKIEALLAKASTFQHLATDRSNIYYEMDDEAYLEYLDSRREETTAAILEQCKTKRSNVYIVGEIFSEIIRKISVRRICDKKGHRNLAEQYVSDLVDQLLKEGRLVAANTKNGMGIRTATKKETSRQIP